MSEEVRAAANNCVGGFIQFKAKVQCWVQNEFGISDDIALRLATEMCGEGDDDELVTEEWIIERGGKCSGRKNGYEFQGTELLRFHFATDGGYRVLIGSEQVYDGLPQPRSQARHYFKALYIETPLDTATETRQDSGSPQWL